MTDEQQAWAVFVECEENQGENLFAIKADTEKRARKRGLNRCDGNGEIIAVDGPYQDIEPGVWEFTYYTEHKETVVVEAPYAEYAEETAEVERDYRGELVQTTHTEKRRLNAAPDGANWG